MWRTHDFVMSLSPVDAITGPGPFIHAYIRYERSHDR